MRILIVDDNEVALEALDSVLRARGLETMRARNGLEALRILRTGRCRLVVTDWMMPGMDGIELCRAIRRESFPGYIYIILLTARHEPDEIVQGLTAGADDFVHKPFHPEELWARVRTGTRILGLETRDVAIFAMAKLAESRDPETGEHLERMRAYTDLLARDLKDAGTFPDVIDDEFVRLLYLTSPLHDIGKVGIPDSVLLKPGRLSDYEFEIMKTHTTIGADTLLAAAEQFPEANYFQIASDIALTHHERYNGSGYPQGLCGEAIPLAGRIVALADVYDALTSARVYKSPYQHAVARSLIVSEAGAHFDPLVVDSFLRIEDAFCEVRERTVDTMPVATT